MVKQADPAGIELSGTKAQQALGAAMMDLFRAHGRFMAADRVIRLTASSLAAALSQSHKDTTPAQVVAVAEANPGVFGLESDGDDPIIATTRFGKAPVARAVDDAHDFAARHMTPVPRLAAQLKGEVIRLDDGWDQAGEPANADALFGTDRPVPAAIIVDRHVLPPARPLTEDEPEEAPAEVPELTPEESSILESIYGWDRAFLRRDESAAATPGEEAPAETPEPVPVDEIAAQIIEDEAPVAFDSLLADTEVEEDVVVAEEPVAADLADVEVAEPVVEVVQPVAEPQPRRVPSLTVTDFGDTPDADIAASIAARLAGDVRIANFNDQWMTEDRVPRLSRGDLRRIKEYIQEQEQPLTDDVLVQDVLNVRPNSPDFDLMRFAINYRLSREHRDYDFVGTNEQRFWSTSTLPQIGTTRRKPNELGTDYRYLLDEVPENPNFHSLDSVLHVVTFFEFYHGLLPYDAEIQALLPAPVLPDQRTAMLTFETPQSYTTFLVELRYPTPNRGGFILGLDDFFNENLVPGALIQIQRTDNDGHYRVEFLPASAQTNRLLELDERRSQRYVFHDVTYQCEVEDAMLLTEDRFGNLANDRPVEDKIRRRPESLVATVFERLGHKSGPGYTATFNDLYTAVNVERPMSEALLRRVLDTDESGAFAKDPSADDAYSYVPPRS